jgi:hypothetical protein
MLIKKSNFVPLSRTPEQEMHQQPMKFLKIWAKRKYFIRLPFSLLYHVKIKCKEMLKM